MWGLHTFNNSPVLTHPVLVFVGCMVYLNANFAKLQCNSYLRAKLWLRLQVRWQLNDTRIQDD